ncbi:NAF1-domain-containing protein [Lophiostoma macrostomum CBS 122681]|uniref:H/ACA ribonucleoprotein complex non-core subunit NAF1 n=1 Tax=Lophiostoma macrostomum CBS 122681 TaxID=1314788 RepID=A0A6A6TP43_9PLEO|nr:NAF1-domain-containing protein [Lophiostoma macrostomum CBS 122681]
MADALEPPAKRARFDEPDPDVPGSPVDDLDDDFYDTTPVKPSPPSGGHDAVSADTPAGGLAPTAISSLQLPGLGLLSGNANQERAVDKGQIHDEELEDGELSDSGSLYHDLKPEEATESSSPKLQAPAPANVAQSDNATSTHHLAVHVNGEGGEAPALKTEHLANESEDGERPMSDAAPATAALEADLAKSDFLRAGEANKGNPSAEWELDSEQSSSSSDSSSDDSDDSSDDDGEEGSDEGELLDPEEQIRRLMEEATGESGPGKSSVRTLNEVAEEYQKPDINMTETTPITILGTVESVVDNLVVIKANTAGDYRVLEPGSALCLANRTIIGKVSEILGRVHEPRYSLGFSKSSDISELRISKDTPIYYVNEHSKFVLTEPLKAQKFTDASNLHDEEANDVEFSDDEKEAEYKKQQKDAKKARAEANREPQETISHIPANDIPAVSQPGQYQGGGLNYDDEDDLGMYKPLARPDHFEHIVGAGAPIEDRSHVRRGNTRGRGGWPDRGRGFRGRGGGPPGPGPGGRGGGGGPHGGRGGGPPGGGGRGHQQRGGRFNNGPNGALDRGGRHQEQNRNRNPTHQEKRGGSSASPNRQNPGQNNGRAAPTQQQQQQQQRSPPRENSSRRNRKRQRRDASPPTSAPPAAAPVPPASANTNAYAQNSAINATGWTMPNSSLAPQTANSYAAPTQPAIPAGSYINPAFYTQQQQAPAQDQQQQQNMAQWAQWFQLAAAMSQNQSQPPPPAQPQPNTAPAYQPQQNAQGSTPSLQDILRTLGGGQQQNR